MKFKYLDILIGVFVAVTLVSNVISVKIFKIGPLNFDGGTILFPLAYILGIYLRRFMGTRILVGLFGQDFLLIS